MKIGLPGRFRAGWGQRLRSHRLVLRVAPSFVCQRKHHGKIVAHLLDNGDDRVFPAGVTCGEIGASPCLYTTVAVLQLDETAKTDTLTLHPKAPTYSFFGGNAAELKKGM